MLGLLVYCWGGCCLIEMLCWVYEFDSFCSVVLG